MILDIEKPTKKRIDKQGNPILNPIILQEIDRLEEKKAKEKTLPAQENRTLNKLKKYGDASQGIQKLIPNQHKNPVKQINNNTALPADLQTIDNVINDTFKGLNPFESMRKNKISTRLFYSYLRSSKKNKEYYTFLTEYNQSKLNLDDFKVEPTQALSQMYEFARATFADSCLGQLLDLAEDVKANRIDSSTYNCISNNLRWIMAKLFPKQYAEKIAIDSQVTTNATQEIDINKIQELSKLL